MGNNKSVTANDKKKEAAAKADEVEKEHETVKEIVEICEFCEDEEYDITEEKVICKTGDHNNYKLVTEFMLNSLPVDIQDKSVFDYISCSEKLVVRLRLKTDRPHKEQATAEHQDRERIKICGTGFAMAESTDIEIYKTCPLKNCAYNDGEKHKSYGGLIIYTNHHVIQNEAEVSSCTVDFFFTENILTFSGKNGKPFPENLKAATPEERTVGPVELEEREEILDSEDSFSHYNDRSDLKSTVSADTNVSHELGVFGRSANVNSNGIDISGGDDHLNKSSSGNGSNLQQNCEEQACYVQNEASLAPDGNRYTPKPETGHGYRLRENKENKDLVGLKIIFHNPELFHYVADCCADRVKAWRSISEPLKKALRRHAIVISHPHGLPKRISFGRLLSLEEDNIENESSADETDGGKRRKKVTIYTTQTCSGSSGAPVLTGHYLYRPFTHSSKRIGKETVNISYSY